MTYWLAFMFKKVTDIIEWLVMTDCCCLVAHWLTDSLTLLSMDCPTDLMIDGWLNDWLTDTTVWGLTEWLNDFWLIELSRDIVQDLTNWLNDLWLIELFGDWPTDWMSFCWLIDWVTDSTVQGLANWLNDFWLIGWLTNWLYCPGTGQLTEWFLADWLTD